MKLILNKGAGKSEIDALNKQLRKLSAQKGLNAKKYCGVIKLKTDPLTIQSKLRDEWE